jgi:DNA processing protein
MESDVIYDIALSFDESLTPIEKTALFENYGSSMEILKIKKERLSTILGRKWTGKRFKPEVFIDRACKLYSFMDKAGIRVLRHDHERFPYGLTKIPDFPFLIYYRGNIEFDYFRSIAVVGTRHPDCAGLERTRIFSGFLSKKGYTVISGLALGIDSEAHLSALENKGKTIAVLGCGIDSVYPACNRGLLKRILEEGGGIISEYPPGTIPRKGNFPKRNRIIVGMSRGVLITQSPARSGSLISALLASDYNKELFVSSPEKKCGSLDQGNIDLIMTGAEEVNSPESIISGWEGVA